MAGDARRRMRGMDQWSQRGSPSVLRVGRGREKVLPGANGCRTGEEAGPHNKIAECLRV